MICALATVSFYTYKVTVLNDLDISVISYSTRESVFDEPGLEKLTWNLYSKFIRVLD